MTGQKVEQAIIDNEKLIYLVIKRHFPNFYNDEDVIQVGRIGLWKACVGYDSSISKFSTYAYKCILNEIRGEVRNQMKAQMFGDVASLDEPLYFDKDGSAITLAHIIPGHNDDYCMVDYDLSPLKGKLSKQDIEVLKLRLYGFSTTEIGKVFGHTRAWASRVMKNAQAVAKAAMTYA